VTKYNRKIARFGTLKWHYTPPWYMCQECGPEAELLEICLIHEHNLVNRQGQRIQNMDIEHIDKLGVRCRECGNVAHSYDSEVAARIDWGEMIGVPYVSEDEPEEEREVAVR